MVDPENVIDFDRSDFALQEFWLFCCCVAGKTARTQARLLENFLTALPKPKDDPLATIFDGVDTPFARLERANLDGQSDATATILQHVIASRLGQYNRLATCFQQSLELNLRTCTVEDLERIHGVGPKTARMFLMHSRPDQRLAALDTHLLKHLQANGYPDAPSVTPSSAKTYRQYEQAFLILADQAGQSPADYDLAVWKSYSRKKAA